MKLLYTTLLTLSLLNANTAITPELKEKAHSMLKEIKPSKKSKLTPKEFITVAALSTGLEKYSMSSYQSRDFSNGQAAFDEPEFYKKECFNPNKYSNMHIKYEEKKVRALFKSYSKNKNYKCLYYTKNAKEVEKTVNIILNNKLHGEDNSVDSIGVLPIPFDTIVPIEKLVSPQYQYEHIDTEYLEYPPKSLEFKQAYKKLWE